MASAIIGALRVNLGMDSAQFQKGLKEGQSRLKGFGKVAGAALAGVGIAAAGAATAVAASVRVQLNAADDMIKAAQKIGLTTEELSRLGHAANLSGVSMSSLQTGVGRLSQAMQQFADGAENEASRAITSLGISVQDAEGNLRSTDAVIEDIAGAFAGMEDGAAKTAAAMAIFGRSGREMIPMLNAGKDGMQGMKAEADALGIVIETKTAKSAEVFNDNMTRLGEVFRGMQVQLANDLAPHFAEFSQLLVEMAPGLLNVAENVIKLGFAFVRGLKALQDFGFAVRALVKDMQERFQEFVNWFNSIPDQIAQIGRDIVDGLISGIKERWESLKSTVTGIGSGIVGWLKNPLQVQSPSRVTHGIGADIMAGLENGLGEGMGGIQDKMGEVVGSIIDGSKSAKEALADLAGELAKMMASQGFNAVFGGAIQGGGLLGGILGGAGRLLGFASGGSFTVGGAGGVDSQVVAFRASPGEMVDIRKPGQDGGDGGSVHVLVGVDPSNGSIVPYVDSRINQASPRIVNAAVQRANAQVVPTMARYQRNTAGGDYRG